MAKPAGYRIAVALTTVLQTGLSLVVPAGVCIWGAKILVDKFSFPEYTTLIGVVFGVAAGFYSMVKYIYVSVRTSYRDNE